MLLSEKVMIRWNGYTRKWYEDKGHIWSKQNDLFECKIEDVMETSPVKILVKCDYCGKEFEKPYRDLLNQRKLVNKDCCSNRECMVSKSEQVSMIKYGEKNHMKTEESKKRLSTRNREDWNKVVQTFKNKGLVLVSGEAEYQNDRSRLKFICDNHKTKGIQETNYSNVKKQKHCCKYGGDEATAILKRVDGNDVYNDFMKYGLIPMFQPSDYIRNDIPLPYLCQKHRDKGVQYKQYTNLPNSKGCEYCAKESRANNLRLSQEVVFNYFKERGLTILDEKYVGKDSHIRFSCNKHPNLEQKTTLNGLRRTKTPCIICRDEICLGNLSRRVRSSLSWWKNYSKKIYKNTCLLTGVEGNVEVHHQKQLDTIIREVLRELEIEIKENYYGEDLIRIKNKINYKHKILPIGVCLNKEIHIFFHIKYGKKECRKEDLEEFIERYFVGEFDDELADELKSINSKRNLEEVMKMTSFYYAEN